MTIQVFVTLIYILTSFFSIILLFIQLLLGPSNVCTGKFGALFASIPFTIFAAVYCVLFGLVGKCSLLFI